MLGAPSRSCSDVSFKAVPGTEAMPQERSLQVAEAKEASLYINLISKTRGAVSFQPENFHLFFHVAHQFSECGLRTPGAPETEARTIFLILPRRGFPALLSGSQRSCSKGSTTPLGSS